MKKIVEEAIARSREDKRNTKTKPPATSGNLRGTDEKELEAVLSSLKTTIRVIGCGGAGTNN
ncbi:MAG: cell division protein FtsZ, partial [Thermoplasmata archaeon]